MPWPITSALAGTISRRTTGPGTSILPIGYSSDKARRTVCRASREDVRWDVGRLSCRRRFGGARDPASARLTSYAKPESRVGATVIRRCARRISMRPAFPDLPSGHPWSFGSHLTLERRDQEPESGAAGVTGTGDGTTAGGSSRISAGTKSAPAEVAPGPGDLISADVAVAD